MEADTAMSLVEHQRLTGKSWKKISDELSEHALARDPDRMNRIMEGRIYKLIGGAKAKSWEVLALVDYLGEGATFY